ncbi:hypothetical protein GCM10027160_48450 [Streptomyces calidiresistens]
MSLYGECYRLRTASGQARATVGIKDPARRAGRRVRILLPSRGKAPNTGGVKPVTVERKGRIGVSGG